MPTKEDSGVAAHSYTDEVGRNDLGYEVTDDGRSVPDRPQAELPHLEVGEAHQGQTDGSLSGIEDVLPFLASDGQNVVNRARTMSADFEEEGRSNDRRGDELARGARPRIGFGEATLTHSGPEWRDPPQSGTHHLGRSGVPHTRWQHRSRPVQRAEVF